MQDPASREESVPAEDFDKVLARAFEDPVLPTRPDAKHPSVLDALRNHSTCDLGLDLPHSTRDALNQAQPAPIGDRSVPAALSPGGSLQRPSHAPEHT